MRKPTLRAWRVIGVTASAVIVAAAIHGACTAGALRAALAKGGYVTFDCGGAAVTIPVSQEISTRGTTVIDGGGKVTLDGGRKNRILVVGQDATLSVRNLRFVNGKATASGNCARAARPSATSGPTWRSSGARSRETTRAWVAAPS
jgi:hypothetical protein